MRIIGARRHRHGAWANGAKEAQGNKRRTRTGAMQPGCWAFIKREREVRGVCSGAAGRALSFSEPLPPRLGAGMHRASSPSGNSALCQGFFLKYRKYFRSGRPPATSPRKPELPRQAPSQAGSLGTRNARVLLGWRATARTLMGDPRREAGAAGDGCGGYFEIRFF